MKKLDRYVLKEMLAPLVIGTFAVALMFQANMLIALYKDQRFDISNVPPLAILQYILYKTPGFLQMTLPVGTALATSLAASRLARETELTAMRSAGISIRRVMRGILLIGLLVGGANFYVTEHVMPKAELSARKLSQDVAMLAAMPSFRSNVVIELKNYIAMVGSVTKAGERRLMLNEVLLLERRPGGKSFIVMAPTGVYNDGVWSIEKPVSYLVQQGQVLSAVTESTMRIEEPIAIPDLFITPEPSELSIPEIRKAIENLERRKAPTRRAEVTLQTRFSVPFACVVFALTGGAFGVVMARKGAFAGVLMSMLVVLAYFNVYVVSTEIIGRYGWVPPWASAWLPNVFFLVLGLFVLWRSE